MCTIRSILNLLSLTFKGPPYFVVIERHWLQIITYMFVWLWLETLLLLPAFTVTYKVVTFL